MLIQSNYARNIFCDQLAVYKFGFELYLYIFSITVLEMQRIFTLLKGQE